MFSNSSHWLTSVNPSIVFNQFPLPCLRPRERWGKSTTTMFIPRLHDSFAGEVMKIAKIDEYRKWWWCDVKSLIIFFKRRCNGRHHQLGDRNFRCETFLKAARRVVLWREKGRVVCAATQCRNAISPPHEPWHTSWQFLPRWTCFHSPTSLLSCVMWLSTRVWVGGTVYGRFHRRSPQEEEMEVETSMTTAEKMF